ncbi:PRC-barrel domain-containing protein [Candidatus Methanosphaera massiliense]|jgi:sporulation protein YlmC with PRC-barrel domain|uniref:PRC-barrel domain-containing protein n=1 Tax=Methanosphaera TaxID=2316 RepID=UPI002380A4FD|nr:PRC-barrel domain-containing protein [Candidatus Methanosphaera massiliense]MDD6285113.1 PRC-barrel domain-containing protein [Methanobacteriaceae archaeon]MDE4078326.1 PRC-barrel domain-containing protein [Candidatus Methanosphaera massiliense]MDY2744320.1 PRC-barrel domain-containing protein [Methanosphaera sp.]
MKITEIIDKKVLDDDANEIGKVQDIDVDLKENRINNITINSNELSLRKTVVVADIDMISEVGDYILLNVPKSEISKTDESKEVPDVEVVNPSELEEKSKSN